MGCQKDFSYTGRQIKALRSPVLPARYTITQSLESKLCIDMHFSSKKAIETNAMMH